MLHTSSWVVTHFLVEEFLELNSVSEERSRNVDAFSSNDNDLLTAQELLGDVRGQTTKHMCLSIDHNNLVKHLLYLLSFFVGGFVFFFNFICFGFYSQIDLPIA